MSRSKCSFFPTLASARIINNIAMDFTSRSPKKIHFEQTALCSLSQTLNGLTANFSQVPVHVQVINVLLRRIHINEISPAGAIQALWVDASLSPTIPTFCNVLEEGASTKRVGVTSLPVPSLPRIRCLRKSSTVHTPGATLTTGVMEGILEGVFVMRRERMVPCRAVRCSAWWTL